jgi:hypothetical protein
MWSTYDFAVEVVLLHHDCVDALGIFEREEAETSGAAGGRVAHDGALANLAEL